jgi:crotonobetainyl-CoA:carnitine CoA-transferase CaiB-like acyl-CoA transferase
LVFVSLSGFGQTGPYRDVPTHGPAFDAYAGLAPPGTDRQGRPRVPHLDLGAVGVTFAPVYAAMATLAAVIRARATDQPIQLDVAQADVAAYATSQQLARRIGADRRAARARSGEPTPGAYGNGDGAEDLFEEAVLVQYYRTSDGRHVLFQAMERKFFEVFCQEVDRPDLLAAYPADKYVDWLYGHDRVRAELIAIFAGRTQREWVQRGIELGLPITPVNVGNALLDDPQFIERRRWIHDDEEHAALLALPVVSAPPLQLPAPAPALGQHTDSVLDRGWLDRNL